MSMWTPSFACPSAGVEEGWRGNAAVKHGPLYTSGVHVLRIVGSKAKNSGVSGLNLSSRLDVGQRYFFSQPSSNVTGHSGQ